MYHEIWLEPSLLEIRALPKLTSSTSTSSTSTSTSTSDSSTSSSSKTGMPSATTSSKTTGMPTLSTSSSSEAYTTPSIGVPESKNNPYIYRNTKPSGTVFIAVGAVVGVILLVFALFHLVYSLAAARTARKTVNTEKSDYHRFARNTAYNGGLVPSSTTLFTHSTQPSMAKLPLMGRTTPAAFGGSQAGDASTIDMADPPTMSHHDLTNMFISPTKEMTHTRLKSQDFSSQTRFSVYGASSKPSPAVGHAPDTASEAPSSVAATRASAGSPDRQKRAPSMYLDDLLDM